ncbi:MAG: hypothetical protein V1846_00810 [Candidatus Komeilibacteria bacterium]
MLSKKPTILLSSIILIVIIIGGGIYSYKKGYFNLSPQASSIPTLTPEKLLSSFIVKNPNLTAEQAQIFQQRFDETKKSLQANSDDFSRWLYLGVLKKGIGDYEGARDVFLYAGQIRPQSSTPFVNLADLYTYFLNEPIKAEENIKKAIANDPNDYNLYLSLADIYRYKFPERQGAYEQTMLEAIVKFPDNANLIAPLAGYFRDTNQTQKAIEWYEKLVKLNPDNTAAEQDLAELKAKK